MAQTSTHYVAALARQARRLGLDIDTLLAEAGISSELSEAGDQVSARAAYLQFPASRIYGD
jgi:hypothetical protein